MRRMIRKRRRVHLEKGEILGDDRLTTRSRDREAVQRAGSLLDCSGCWEYLLIFTSSTDANPREVVSAHGSFPPLF